MSFAYYQSISPSLTQQVLHDPDNSPAPPSRGKSQRPGRYRQDGDGKGLGEGPGDVRDRHQLLRGSGLQVHGAHVQWTGPGEARTVLVAHDAMFLVVLVGKYCSRVLCLVYLPGNDKLNN